MIKIIAIGKKHEPWIIDAIERYHRRLRAPWNVEWELLPHSSLEDLRARQEESERILSRLRPTDFIILLDETGKQLDSPALSVLLDRSFTSSKEVVIIIGGAYGVTQALHDRAAFIWSLSKLVFPHQLVRAITLEQLYRAQEIARGSKYHHQ